MIQWVLSALVGGAVVLCIFVVVENAVAEPMFELSLFCIRAVTAGHVASLLSGLGRGGLMFILIIWLPRHGYSFADTPLLLNSIGMGLIAAPNRAGIMNALPPNRRSVGAGMSATFQNWPWSFRSASSSPS
ncbi:hypothetical protein AAGW05_08845 [Arthrobacter sp. LAPM80]|uniref:hypothetical protein n=1 Tax=Arthrobacter sp. LAPM80 TaxID=3141788 RepID=UPI00398AA469